MSTDPVRLGTGSQMSRLASRFAGNASRGLLELVRPPRLPPERCRLMPALVPFALAASVIVASAAAAMWSIDHSAVAFARTVPHAARWWFEHLTDFGKSGWFLYPAAAFIVFAWVCASDSLGRIANLVLASMVVRIGFVFLAIGLPGLVVTIGKRLIGRLRPSDHGPFAFEPWSWKAAYASLPSGHATTAFAAAVAVSLLWPRARLFIWTFAVMIAASRVAVTAHYPSDVLAGAGAGIFGALIVRNWFAQRRLGFFVDPNGRVRAMPGPSLHRIKTLARRVLGY